ncbi:MAG: NADH-quinone oxidoreductase subunit M, partial [Limisphaerales bacterium]
MILAWLIIVPVLGGLLSWWLGRWGQLWSRCLAVASMSVDLILCLVLWGTNAGQLELIGGGKWLKQLEAPWIPQLGINFHLAIDGLSLLMVLLTAFLGILSVVASWSEIKERVGFFHLNLMLVLAGVIGVF